MVGFVVIALVVVAFTALLYERHYGLWIGLTAGFQGAAYIWLLRFCHARVRRA